MELMRVELLGPDCKDLGAFDVQWYKIFADGVLEIRLADGSDKTFHHHEWMDVRQSGAAEAFENPKHQGGDSPG